MEFKKEYLETGAICPFCRSEQIVGGPIEVIGTTASQQVACEVCYASWNDCYELVDVTLVEEPENESPRPIQGSASEKNGGDQT